MEKILKLLAWTLCGNISLQEAFQRKQRKYLVRHGEAELIDTINLQGDWLGWCSSRSVDPFQPSIVEAVEFLFL